MKMPEKGQTAAEKGLKMESPEHKETPDKITRRAKHSQKARKRTRKFKNLSRA